jgi:hypothetical protein
MVCESRQAEAYRTLARLDSEVVSWSEVRGCALGVNVPCDSLPQCRANLHCTPIAEAGGDGDEIGAGGG